MFAADLQRLLSELCRTADASPLVHDDMERRFRSLRGYNRLPMGRENRNAPLSDKQIACAVLGLGTEAPGWAGHAATVLSRRFPVGGALDAFCGAPTLLDALACVLSNEAARCSLVALTLSMAEGGVNSAGYATLVWDHEDGRRRTRYVAAEAVSLLQLGAEQRFDFDRRYVAASRELTLNRVFFDRLVRRVKQNRDHPPELQYDSSEYDAEEAERARRIRLGANASSRFLNVGVDNQVTWPREETLIRFSGHTLILKPKTAEHVQSVHVDLHANGLSDTEAITLINRLLSLMTWCDDQFAIMQDGWSGNPVPVAVPRRDLLFTTAHQWLFDRRIPDDDDARRALALYREGRNAEQNYMVSYAVLNFYKIIEIRHKGWPDSTKWVADNLPRILDDLSNQQATTAFLVACGEEAPETYIYAACRVAVAHVSPNRPSDPDDALELRRLHNAADIMRLLARRFIAVDLGVSQSPFGVSVQGDDTC